MNEIEERLWNYIDGNCTPQEHIATARLIESNPAYRSKYEELLLLNNNLQNLELEEPPMAFTYNVMESIRAEQAMRPLKASINKRIIQALAAFFVITITALLIYALATTHWSNNHDSGNFANQFKVTASKNYLTPPVLKSFLFFDVLLLLALFDTYLRRHNYMKRA